MANYVFTCKEDVVKFKFHNFGQVIRACNNHMEAFLEENKNFWSDHYVCPPAKSSSESQVLRHPRLTQAEYFYAPTTLKSQLTLKLLIEVWTNSVFKKHQM